MSLQADRIEAIQMRTISTGRERKRRDILTDRTTPSDHDIVSDAHKLKHTGQPPDDGMISDRDMSGQARCVGHNNMVAEPAIVRHMHIGHENTLGP